MFLSIALLYLFINCEISIQPTHYDQYFTELIHSETEKPADIESYYVKDITKQGVLLEPNSGGVNMSLYHINKEDDTSYWIFQIGEGLYECMKTEVEFEELDILDYLLKNLLRYEGSGDCAEEEEENRQCEKWSIDYHTQTCYYYEYKDTKAPCCVERLEDKKIIYKFKKFIHGTKSFDESKIFKLPIDPKECKYQDAPKRYPLSRGRKYSKIKLVDLHMIS